MSNGWNGWRSRASRCRRFEKSHVTIIVDKLSRLQGGLMVFSSDLYLIMPPRKTPKKPKALPIPGSASYPGKKDGKGMEQPQWEACRAMLEDVYQTDEDG